MPIKPEGVSSQGSLCFSLLSRELNPLPKAEIPKARIGEQGAHSKSIEGEISQSQEDKDCKIYRDRKKSGGCQRLQVGIMES